MDKITKIWIALLLFSSFAFGLGWFEMVSDFFVALLLLTTFIKGYLVIEYFMGLREVSLKYRIIPTVWLTIVLSFVFLLFLA